jgi:hypothetical protein
MEIEDDPYDDEEINYRLSALNHNMDIGSSNDEASQPSVAITTATEKGDLDDDGDLDVSKNGNSDVDDDDLIKKKQTWKEISSEIYKKSDKP